MNIEQEQIITDLMEYLSIERGEVIDRIQRGADLVRDRWLKENPTTPEEETRFYMMAIEYLYDLAAFDYFSPESLQFKSVISRLSEPPVLDYGGGIGDQVLRIRILARQIHYLDLKESEVWKFARWRFKQCGLIIPMYGLKDPIPINYFKTVICLDVLEHVPDPYETLKIIALSMKKLGTLFLTYPHGRTPQHPMHHDKPPGFDLERSLIILGFKKIGNNYIKMEG